MMRVLITGGAGYIGSLLVPALLERGYEVTALDTFRYGQTSLLPVCHHPKFTIVRGDVRDENLLRSLLAQADIIFPLACLTGAPICDRYPTEAQEVIVGAVDAMLRFRSSEQQIIYPTTNSGYGVGENNIYCTEETLLRPVSLYGRLKVEAERKILEGGHAITLRLATAFGVSPQMRLDLLVNNFVHRALSDGHVVLFQADFKRNYIHVRDVVQVFLHALDHFDTMKNQTYNVGLSDANLSKRELCDEIKKQIPRFYYVEAAVGEDSDQRNYIVSNEKIERTGFRPQHSLADGITELIRAYPVLAQGHFSNI